MKPLEWHSESEFAIDGVNFQCVVADYSGKTDENRFILLKDRSCLDRYATVFADQAPKNILEFGIFQGGSPVLFSLWFGTEKFVGVDFAQPVAAFDEFCRRHPVGNRIRTHYGVLQSDQDRIEQIVREEFGSTPLDVVIDDASHQYEYSRRTFEITFPLLRPGGTYVLEDWGWAHWPGFELGQWYEGRSPLSMLLMELTMLCASRPDLIKEVRVFPEFAFIHKSPDARPMEHFALTGSYNKRNIEVIGVEHVNLESVSRLLAARMKQLSRLRLARAKRKLLRPLRGRKRR